MLESCGTPLVKKLAHSQAYQQMPNVAVTKSANSCPAVGAFLGLI